MSAFSSISEVTLFEAALPAEPDLSAEIEGLRALDAPALRARWRKHLRNAPPNLNRPMLLRLLAYRLQARAFGDLDVETARYLDRVARDGARRRGAGEARPKAVPPVQAVTRQRGLKPGTVLVREHGGSVHHVTVMKEGFAWKGETYSNLSEIARAITGTRWSGPRFFGLREVPSVAPGMAP